MDLFKQGFLSVLKKYKTINVKNNRIQKYIIII
jgi:hypothetical protein